MAPSRGIVQANIRIWSICRRCVLRGFATSAYLNSGHNRWSKIKHDKGKNDAAKNRQRSSFSQEIANASKLYGPDPESNPRLADIIAKAKRDGFAKASIEGAIARGQGKSAGGEKLEHVTVEAILPGNIGLVVECTTDNKARTMMDIRHVVKEAGGSATPSAYLFEKRGRVVFDSQPGKGLEEVLDIALDAGATDVEEHEEGRITILCEPSDTKAVGETIATQFGLHIAMSDIIWKPVRDTLTAVESAEAAEGLGTFIDQLQQREPSVAIAMNVAPGSLTDEAWRELEARLST